MAEDDQHELSIKPGPGRKHPDDEPEPPTYAILEDARPATGCHGCRTFAAIGTARRAGANIVQIALGVGGPCAQCVRAPAYGQVKALMESMGVIGKDMYQPEDEYDEGDRILEDDGR